MNRQDKHWEKHEDTNYEAARHFADDAVDPSDIRPHMPVLCSEDEQFAVVDRMESPDTIKLARDERRQHHYIPLSWVTRVDDQVHVDRPGDVAMQDWTTVAPRA